VVQGPGVMMQGHAVLRFRDIPQAEIGQCLSLVRSQGKTPPRHPAGTTWENYRGQQVRVRLPPLAPEPEVWGACDSPVVWAIAEEWLAERGIKKAAGCTLAVCWHMVEVD